MSTITALSDWLASTALSQYFQITLWVIPAMQTVHILCLAVLLAGAVLVDLRILGGALRSQSLSAVAARFLPAIVPLVLALAVTAALRRFAATDAQPTALPIALAVLSMVLWTTIIVAGRYIAYVEPL